VFSCSETLSNATRKIISIYRVAQQKWYQLTFLLVTFECPDLIRLFLLTATTVYSHTLRSITV